MGTSSVQKDTMQAWPVALVQREEHDGTRRYYIDSDNVRIVYGTKEKDGTFVPAAGIDPRFFPRDDFAAAAHFILHLLKEIPGECVEVPEELETFLDALQIYDLEAKQMIGPIFYCILAFGSTSHWISSSLSAQSDEPSVGWWTYCQFEAGADGN